ncbi:lipoate--protein ligase [Halomonas garicola]|uniref:lipoate--protein ligase n=1 Tax=Halomonas garicola TaxID=1690008 RepID=UPI00289A99C9|nr:lipoate--protein ligase [Halomonas garicola]
MIYIDNEGITDPHVNLAIEEHCIRHLPAGEDYLLFYINAPSIIIGRNQNTLEEIHQAYIDEHGIHVVRRISGGGAVYHDQGNLNFSFLTDFSKDKLNNFKQFATPIIEVLNGMGVAAEMKGRNDIVVGDKKISGNAQFSSTRRMFNHGTLLLDCDLSQVSRALDVKMTKITSKGHKSSRSRVANIAEFLDAPLSTEAFKEKILDGIFPDGAERQTYRLTEQDWESINALVEEKYGRWEWNYGRSPEFDIQRTRHFAAGIIDFRLKVKRGGTIENVKIYGDFFGQHPVSDIEEALVGVRYDRQDIEAALAGFDLYAYFGDVDRTEFINLIYGPDEA